jgi:hypothetical protein
LRRRLGILPTKEVGPIELYVIPTLVKGSQIIAHRLTLLSAEVKALQEANQVKKRRERKQKRCIY